LNIVEMFPDRFRATALAAKDNVDLLAAQIERFRPEIAVVFDAERADRLSHLLSKDVQVEILWGDDGYRAAAEHGDTDMVVAAMMGAAGLAPTMAGISAKKEIALANKETLVMAGQLVMDHAALNGVTILPVDSEHSAIFQSLSGQRREDLDKILLTASGGPFRHTPMEDFGQITPADALKHPNWQMGRKITIDSATLMNKGLEVIEAKWLFGVSEKQIQVIVHPQSIVHSMVAYRDGSVIAQLGVPDMKGAIAYAMSYPERLPIRQPAPDFAALGALSFEDPDLVKFPCLAMAFRACGAGGTMPAVLNAANEVAVASFLEERIPFTAIPEVIESTMDRHSRTDRPSLPDVLAADRWARGAAGERIMKIQG
jgi:1-deoxy-D-xylulose-5-phosphate reductoisomerase